MSKKESVIHKPEFTQEDRQAAEAIVDEMLGVGFQIDCDSFPKNVGIKGDEGVHGSTLVISGGSESVRNLMTSPDDPDWERLADVSKALTNVIYPATKVLLDITPIQTEE